MEVLQTSTQEHFDSDTALISLMMDIGRIDASTVRPPAVEETPSKVNSPFPDFVELSSDEAQEIHQAELDRNEGKKNRLVAVAAMRGLRSVVDVNIAEFFEKFVLKISDPSFLRFLDNDKKLFLEATEAMELAMARHEGNQSIQVSYFFKYILYRFRSILADERYKRADKTPLFAVQKALAEALPIFQAYFPDDERWQ